MNTELKDIQTKISDLDADLCSILCQTSVGSEADKWLESAHEHLKQAQHRIGRALSTTQD